LILRKLTSAFVWVLIALSALGGIGFVANIGKPTASGGGALGEYAEARALAEQFTAIYLTVDEHADDRRMRLAVIAPDASPLSSKAVKESQQVEGVYAGNVYHSGARTIVEVEAWASTMKDVEVEPEKLERQRVLRHYQLTVYLEKDGQGKYFVSGLPIVREQQLPKSSERVMDEELVATRDAMMPTLQAVVPAVFKGDMHPVVNYLADETSINLYHGEFEFVAITNVWVRESAENEYIVDVDVEVRDSLLRNTQYIRLNTVMKMIEGKYYLERVV
jgi:hypothetical protein